MPTAPATPVSTTAAAKPADHQASSAWSTSSASSASSLAEIAERVHRPGAALVADLARTDGDLIVLGAAGKMGVSLARMAGDALAQLPGGRSVIAVSRFTDAGAKAELEAAGVRTVAADLADDRALAALPDAANVVYMVGRKFGTASDSSATWMANVYLPARVAQRYAGARISAFSSGNLYPLVPLTSGGADEDVPPDPVGEYAQTCLGRERVFTHVAAQTGSPLALIRLNYAIDCRYGVLTDIARAVLADRPVPLDTGAVNVVWQGDANRYALGALAHIEQGSDPLVLNVTGPETASVRWLARELGRRLGRTPEFTGQEAPTALLSNAARCFGLFGYPEVTLHQMLDWTAQWLTEGGTLLSKPTMFTERSGRF